MNEEATELQTVRFQKRFLAQFPEGHLASVWARLYPI
jgi:hypothetical protein